MTPVLTAGGAFDSQTLLEKFLGAAADLEPRITEEVQAHINGFQG
jgi:hypothetical protein